MPQVTLDQSIAALSAGLSSMGFADRDFRNSKQIRVKVLEEYISADRLTASLRWQNGSGSAFQAAQ